MSANDPAGVESTGTTTAGSPITTDPQSTVDWEGPFYERDAYGALTGATYVRCPDCHVEVVTAGRAHVTHREGCQHR